MVNVQKLSFCDLQSTWLVHSLNGCVKKDNSKLFFNHLNLYISCAIDTSLLLQRQKLKKLNLSCPSVTILLLAVKAECIIFRKRSLYAGIPIRVL